MFFLFLNYLFYFILKREVYYHKIQYSKVFKHDIAAAVLGITIGALVVYLSLSTLGSGSPDLSDLSILFWYIFLFYIIFNFININLNYKNLNLYFLLYELFIFILYYIILYWF